VILRELRNSNELSKRNLWLENRETNQGKVNHPAGVTLEIQN
jgi:hypothetical protein